MKKRFIAVIGAQNTGKSTIIKSLTGCKTASTRDWVVDQSTKRRMWVICSSPQEQIMPIIELRRIVRQASTTQSCIALVVAIQPSTPSKRISMEDIFQEVDKSGAFENFAYTMSSGYNGNGYSTSGLSAIQSRITGISPSTITAQIDGRRFSFLNAAFIRNSSAIPY